MVRERSYLSWPGPETLPVKYRLAQPHFMLKLKHAVGPDSFKSQSSRACIEVIGSMIRSEFALLVAIVL